MGLYGLEVDDLWREVPLWNDLLELGVDLIPPRLDLVDRVEVVLKSDLLCFCFKFQIGQPRSVFLRPAFTRVGVLIL